MKGVDAEVMYEAILKKLREALPGKVEAGKFGAMMQVEILNDGRMLSSTNLPSSRRLILVAVTIEIDSRQRQ